MVDFVNNKVKTHVESVIDYAAGTIFFKSDNAARGPLAILEYSSDGMDAYATFECDEFPRL